MAGKRIYLRFMGVKFVSEVFLNGKKVGGHYGGWEPFELCVTDACKVGEENDLLVRASDVRSVIDEEMDEQKLKPGMEYYQLAHDSIMAPIVSMFHYFGIWQDVSLVAHENVRIADVFVRTSVRKKEIAVDITAENLTDQKQTVRLGVRALDGEALPGRRDIPALVKVAKQSGYDGTLFIEDGGPVNDRMGCSI